MLGTTASNKRFVNIAQVIMNTVLQALLVTFSQMVMPNQHSQRLESIFLCTTQATQTGQ